MKNSMKSIFDRRIVYAANDCLAVTKLLMAIEFLWTKEQLDRYNNEQHQHYKPLQDWYVLLLYLCLN